MSNDNLDSAVSTVVPQIALLGTQLQDSAWPQAVATAHEILGLGIAERGSLLPRGTPTQAAPTRLLRPEPLWELGRCLTKQVREDAFVAVLDVWGEWGGQEVVESLRAILGEGGATPSISEAALQALYFIGGPVATDALERAATFGPAPDRACWLLNELMAGGTVDATYGPYVL